MDPPLNADEMAGPAILCGVEGTQVAFSDGDSIAVGRLIYSHEDVSSFCPLRRSKMARRLS
jgi:hypothetical protein